MKKEINVLQISTGDYFRGSEKQQLEWFNHIDKNIKFTFLSPSDNTYKEYEKIINKKGSLHYLDIKRNNFINKIKYLNRLYKFLKVNKYDIVHINSSAFLTSFTCAYVARKTKQKKIIVHSHNDNKYKINIFKRIIINILNPLYRKLCDGYLSCSKNAEYSLFTNNFINKNKIKILKNGIDIDKYKFNENLRDKYRKELNIEDKVVYGHTGSFTKEKNHKYLINLFYEIQKVNPESVLLLIGEGILIDDIKKLSFKLGIEDKIIFLGFRKDVNELLNCMDIFIFPSIYEGLGISVIESQTNGLLTYASNGIPNEANISPYFRYFNLKDNINDLTNRIINDISLDRENAYKYIKDNGYDIKDVTNELEQYYYNL